MRCAPLRAPQALECGFALATLSRAQPSPTCQTVPNIRSQRKETEGKLRRLLTTLLLPETNLGPWLSLGQKACRCLETRAGLNKMSLLSTADLGEVRYSVRIVRKHKQGPHRFFISPPSLQMLPPFIQICSACHQKKIDMPHMAMYLPFRRRATTS